MIAGLTCAELREEIARRNKKIQKHQAAIDELRQLCLHDETREQRDYQDPKAYRVCLGCGKGFI